MKRSRQIRNRTLGRGCLAAGLLLGFVASASANTTWTLNAKFSDGLTAVGTFTTSGGSSSVAPTFISWDVTFANGPAKDEFVDTNTSTPRGVASENVLPNIYLGYGGGPAGTVAELTFAHQPSFNPYVDIYLNAPLTNAGGPITLIGGYDCPGCGLLDPTPTSSLVSGAVAVQTGVAALPEPSAIALLGAVGSLLGVTIFRRRKVTQ